MAIKISASLDDRAFYIGDFVHELHKVQDQSLKNYGLNVKKRVGFKTWMKTMLKIGSLTTSITVMIKRQDDTNTCSVSIWTEKGGLDVE